MKAIRNQRRHNMFVLADDTLKRLIATQRQQACEYIYVR
jgi:hypothetical protein